MESNVLFSHGFCLTKCKTKYHTFVLPRRTIFARDRPKTYKPFKRFLKESMYLCGCFPRKEQLYSGGEVVDDEKMYTK